MGVTEQHNRRCKDLAQKFCFVGQFMMSFFKCLFTIVALATGIECKRLVNVLYSAETVGNTGDWGNLDVCPSGEYVVGFSLKSEKNKGVSDDTGLNGIRLRCSGGKTVSSTVQKWGKWTNEQKCKNGVVHGFQIQIEPYRGAKDDSGANNVNLVCKAFETGYESTMSGKSLTKWGKWSHGLKCKSGQVAVGIQTRVQESKGVFKDDSALNGMKLLCASNPLGPIAGDFDEVTSGHCTKGVTEPFCKAAAKAAKKTFAEIKNPNLHYYPKGCYYHVAKKIFYFNLLDSAKKCTTTRVCVCAKYGMRDSPTASQEDLKKKDQDIPQNDEKKSTESNPETDFSANEKRDTETSPETDFSANEKRDTETKHETDTSSIGLNKDLNEDLSDQDSKEEEEEESEESEEEEPQDEKFSEYENKDETEDEAMLDVDYFFGDEI